MSRSPTSFSFFFFNDTATTEIYTLSLHDALPIFGLGLGPVAGDHLGGGPVVVAGDQHVLAEDLFFQGGAGVRVDAPGQAQVLGLLAVQLPGDDPAGPGFAGDRLDLSFDLVARSAGLSAGPGAG